MHTLDSTPFHSEIKPLPKKPLFPPDLPTMIKAAQNAIPDNDSHPSYTATLVDTHTDTRAAETVNGSDAITRARRRKSSDAPSKLGRKHCPRSSIVQPRESPGSEAPDHRSRRDFSPTRKRAWVRRTGRCLSAETRNMIL